MKYVILAQSGETIIDINLTKDDDAYLAGHTIDGRVLFPATGYMTLAWRQFAKMKNSTLEKTPVVLEDVVFHRATILPKDGSVKFGINFFDGTGRFEICEGGSLAVSGKIYVPEDIDSSQLQLNPLATDASGLVMNTNDVYKELRLRGYDYGGKFRGITECDSKAVTGKLTWDDNWISFMDTMLQFSIMGKDLRELYLPTRIEKVVINPLKHYQIIENVSGETKSVDCFMYKYINVIKSGGVEMRGLRASLAPKRSGTQSTPILERYNFIPYVNDQQLCETDERARQHAVAASVQLAVENSGGALKLKVADIVGDKPLDNILAQLVQHLIESEPTLVTDVAIITNHSAETYVQALGDSGIRVVSKDALNGPVEQNCHIIVSYDVISQMTANVLLKNMRDSIRDDGFILLEENVVGFDITKADKLFASLNLAVVSVQRKPNKFYYLLRPIVDFEARNKQIVFVTETNYKWVEELKTALATAEESNRYVYIVSQGEELFGALGFINCIKNEAGGKFARMIYVQDKNVEKFSFTSKFFVDQLKKDLLTNVYKQGTWGSFRHLKLEFEADTPTLQVEHAYVNALTKGDLSSLHWIEGPLSRQLPDPKDKKLELCTVYYAPINFRDVMLSSGKLAADALPGDLATQDCILGLEFSGRDSTGRRVMAMVSILNL